MRSTQIIRSLALLALLVAATSGQAPESGWDDIHFESGSATLAEGFSMLSRLATLLQGHPGYKAYLSGGSDPTTDGRANAGLGLRRAQAVRDYLIRGGASSAQIQTKSDADTGSRLTLTKFQSRRVEIQVIAPDGTPIRDGQVAQAAINEFEAYTRGQLGKIDETLAQLQDTRNQLRMAQEEALSSRNDRAAIKQQLDTLQSQLTELKSAPQSVATLPASPAPPSTPSWKGGYTGRAFLIGRVAESPRYGLYSYLLIPRKPAANETELKNRYIAALDSYLTITAIEAFQDWTEPPPASKLNITYFPISFLPTKLVAEAMLPALNDGRAKEILASLSKQHQTANDGPFIVAYNKPLTGLQDIGNHQHLYFDLTGVPPKVVSLYVHAFVVQSQREQFWIKDRNTWLVDCYNYIEQGGAVFDDVQKQFTGKAYLATIFKWFN